MLVAVVVEDIVEIVGSGPGPSTNDDGGGASRLSIATISKSERLTAILKPTKCVQKLEA